MSDPVDEPNRTSGAVNGTEPGFEARQDAVRGTVDRCRGAVRDYARTVAGPRVRELTLATLDSIGGRLRPTSAASSSAEAPGPADRSEAPNLAPQPVEPAPHEGDGNRPWSPDEALTEAVDRHGAAVWAYAGAIAGPRARELSVATFTGLGDRFRSAGAPPAGELRDLVRHTLRFEATSLAEPTGGRSAPCYGMPGFLLSRADGRGSPATAAIYEQHLAACSPCSTWHQRLLEAEKALDQGEPAEASPPSWLVRALRGETDRPQPWTAARRDAAAPRSTWGSGEPPVPSPWLFPPAAEADRATVPPAGETSEARGSMPARRLEGLGAGAGLLSRPPTT